MEVLCVKIKQFVVLQWYFYKCLWMESSQFNSGSIIILMDRSLKKLYQSLPRIVLKGKFLVPQPPRRRSALISYVKDPFAKLKQRYPYAITSQVHKLAQEDNKSALMEILTRENRKSFEQYQIKIRDYMANIIEPLKIVPKGIRPQFFYYQQHKKTILEEMTKASEFNLFKFLNPYFKQLPQAEQQIYRVKCHQAILQKLKIYNQAAAKYSIPKPTFVHPHILYLRDTIDTPITQEMLGKYKLLPDEAKEKYRSQSKELKQKDKQKLQIFLHSHNINLSQFNFIKQVCLEVEKVNARLIEERKRKKTLRSQEKNKTISKTKQIEKQQQLQFSEQFQEWKKNLTPDQEILVDDEEQSSDDKPNTLQSTFKQAEKLFSNDLHGKKQ